MDKAPQGDSLDGDMAGFFRYSFNNLIVWIERVKGGMIHVI